MKRDNHLVIMIEPVLKDKVADTSSSKGKTTSAYVRDLIIADLLKKEVIDNAFLLKMLMSDEIPDEEAS